jgi:hypothetical protein
VDELLTLLRSGVAAHPLLLGLLLFPASWWLFARVARDDISHRTARRLAAVARVPILYYVAIAVWYSTNDAYFDAAEPTIPAVAWAVASGQQLYHAADAAARYSHVYGPVLFVLHAGWLRLLGPGLIASKSLGTTAALFGLVACWRALRHSASREIALALTGLATIIYLAFRNMSFWTRPEPLLLLCVSTGLLAALQPGSAVAILAAGIAAGLATGTKATMPCVFLPILALVYVRHGWRACLAAIAIAVPIAFAPFALWPNISLDGYRFWLAESAHSGFRLAAIRLNVEWALFLLAPAGVWLATWPHSDDDRRMLRLVLPASVAGLIGVVVTGSKPGAGQYHLMPFVPPLLWLAACGLQRLRPAQWRRPVVRASIAAYVVAAAIPAVIQQQYFWSAFDPYRLAPVARELRTFASSNGTRSIAMGYGGDYRLSFYRPLLVFLGNSYVLDAPAVIEEQRAGIPLPEATLDALRRCEVDTWLIPKGGAPFTMVNPYPETAGADVFGDTFRRAFYGAYRHAGDTTHFEVWQCASPTRSR